MKNHVFLSYSRHDALIMNRICNDLRERGLTVWTDENLDPTKPDWKIAVQNLIVNSGSLVALVSPEAKQSEFAQVELEYAASRNISIFPVLLSGDEMSSMPPKLAHIEYINLTQPADYQPGVEYLYDKLAKHLGIKSRLEANELETVLLELGEKLTGATDIGLVNIDGLLMAAVNCASHTVGNTLLFTRQTAAMIATTVSLADKVHQRMGMNQLCYFVSGSPQDMLLAIYFEQHIVGIFFNDIIPVDSILATIQNSIQPLLDVLGIKTQVKF